MRIGRITTLSLGIATFAVLGAGCQRADTTAAAAMTEKTTAVCDDFRHIEVNHHNDKGDLKAFNTAIATDLTTIAGRATDRTIATQLQAVSAQYVVLAGQVATATDMDEIEKANPAVFTAANQAWLDLETRCGKALIPAP